MHNDRNLLTGGLIDLSLAGLNIRLFYPEGDIGPELDGTCKPFLDNHAGKRIDINIRLEPGNLPETVGLTRLFDGNGVWELFREGEDYLLQLNNLPGGRVVCLARFRPGSPGVTIHCGQMLISERERGPVVANPFRYPLDKLLMMYLLAEKGGLMIHAAGAEIKEKGYVFAGRSGAGKSTISNTFSRREGITPLTDERVVVRKIGETFKVFGTPWAGDSGIAENRAFDLAGIFFIGHGKENRIREIGPSTALEKLLPVVSIPWFDEQMMDSFLALCEDLLRSVPAYETDFRPGVEIAEQLERFLDEKKEPQSRELSFDGPFQPEVLELFTGLLEEGKSLRVRVTGRSMAPFLKDGDVLTIEKAPVESLRVGDILFCRGHEGQALLHRLIKKGKAPDGSMIFYLKGDALGQPDAPVPVSDLLGRVSYVEREVPGGGKKGINLGSPYRRVSNFILALVSRLGLRRNLRRLLAVFR